jgi:hypothetical protein
MRHNQYFSRRVALLVMKHDAFLTDEDKGIVRASTTMADSIAWKLGWKMSARVGIPECVVDTGGKTVLMHGLAHTDDNPMALSIKLESAVTSKSFPLKFLFGIPGSILSRPTQC